MAGQFGDRGPDVPLAVAVPGQQPVGFQADGQAVRSGPGELGPLAQIGKPAR